MAQLRHSMLRHNGAAAPAAYLFFLYFQSFSDADGLAERLQSIKADAS